jgi:hypothetical protein
MNEKNMREKEAKEQNDVQRFEVRRVIVGGGAATKCAALLLSVF